MTEVETMANKVTKSNLLSESRNNIVEILQNNVTNPSGNPKWIYARRPKVKNLSFNGFPFLVVYPSRVTFGSPMTVNGQKKKTSFSIEIEVVTQDAAVNQGKGLMQLDSVTDQVLEQLNSKTNRDTLRANGLLFVDPDVSGVGDEEWNSTKIVTRTIMLTFSDIKKVY